TITGTTEAPRVAGEFEVTQGGFRNFHYETLRGTAEYADGGAIVDAYLQQSPSQWMTAKGYVPLPSAKSEGSTNAAKGMDLAVDSSPIDLGLVQGLTTSVTDVTGTMEVHAQVKGTLDDPQPTGAFTITNGAMTVSATGVRYTNIAGQVD